MNSFKKDFPIFKNNPKLVYLDSASTSKKPKQVINSSKNFYEKENANIHRGIYSLSENATKKYNQSRETIAKFINAETNEIIFTKNTTESINLLSHVLKKNNFKLKFIPITKNYELDYRKAKEIINDKTAILGVAHISNVFGTINNIEFLVS